MYVIVNIAHSSLASANLLFSVLTCTVLQLLMSLFYLVRKCNKGKVERPFEVKLTVPAKPNTYLSLPPTIYASATSVGEVSGPLAATHSRLMSQSAMYKGRTAVLVDCLSCRKLRENYYKY